MRRNQLSDRIRKLCWGILSLKIYKIAPVFYVFRSAWPLARDGLCPAGECLSSLGLNVSLKDTQTWGERDQDEGRWKPEWVRGGGRMERRMRRECLLSDLRRAISSLFHLPVASRLSLCIQLSSILLAASQAYLVPLSHLILLEVVD